MKGIIIKGIGGLYTVKTEEGKIESKARGRFRYDKDRPLVGDRVEISFEGKLGVIEKIYNRETELIRPLVANVSHAFVVFALKKPDINEDLLNKFLVICEDNNLKVTVCFNKIDLSSPEEIQCVEMVKQAGYEVVFTCARDGIGIEDLKEKLCRNISVLCGPSGVGKSTLLNALLGREHMETGEISKKVSRGKHTTRHSELIEYEDGFLVDTPGFSSLETIVIDKENLINCFPEFQEYNGKCKFSNCYHHKEPGCILKEAVEQGKIHKMRYEFYLKLLQEANDRRNKSW
ncbi:MAG: ribosome small subunit-dependent GTPase A [Clostridium sp.]